MKKYIENQIELLKNEVDYYKNVINNIGNLKQKDNSKDNYLDRELFYANYHLSKLISELDRLTNYKGKVLKK